jgi:hypothetical protein
LAAVFFIVLSASSQRLPSTLPQNCSPQDQRAPLADRSLNVYAASGSAQADATVGLTGALIRSLQSQAFPELVHVDLRVRSFHSDADYFRTRFSIPRFVLLMRMRYFVDVNSALLQAQPPSDGVCAILAHELVHVVSLSRGNRIRRFGLIRLLSMRQTAKFERGTDLEAIHRGYGDGLKSYRGWVYTHVPPNQLQAKLRNYFSPEEIAAIQVKLQAQPSAFAYWTRHVPANLKEIANTPR